MNRVLNPSLNPAGLSAAVLALYALGEGIWNVTHHAGAIDPQVIVAAIAAVAALFTRQVVTPVADPKDGAFRPLGPVVEYPSPPVINVSARTARRASQQRAGAAAAPSSLDEERLSYPRHEPMETGFEPAAAAEAQPEPGRPVSSDPRERSAL